MSAITPTHYLIGYSGELSIKAKGTRNRFAKRLMNNLTEALDGAGVEYEKRRTWSRLFIASPSDEVALYARRIFGVSSVLPAVERRWRSLDELLAIAHELFAPQVAGKTFAVRVRRGGERSNMPFRSPEVERRLGSLLLPHAAGVNLSQPELEVRIELHSGRAYFFSRQLAGPGGLPIGTEGRAIGLVSGGFDSAVAAWLMLRRGVRLDYVFCNLGGDAHRDEVLRVMKVIADDWSFGYRPRLYIVDFRPLVEEIQQQVPRRLWQVVLKRQMLRAAQRIAWRVKAAALVTGEAVGQVSSQTLKNLAVISAVAEMPILRPLATSNKEEILATARHIGTYDLSAKVPEYCALTARHPETHASAHKVDEAEVGLDRETLLALVAECTVLDLRALDLEKMCAADLEVEEVPEGAVVLDLRSQLAFKSWRYPGAERLDYAGALAACRSFDRGKVYVAYCEVGLKSAHLAQVMHEAGLRAFHFRGGLKHLVRYAAGRDEALLALMSPALLTK